MHEWPKLSGYDTPPHHFDEIRISIASPEQIRSWSSGEIKKPDTINYRTHKPERDGLFCACIFGPIKDYECLCGKYRRKKFKGLICEKCGVEVTASKVRRERMGHIELVSPVAHIWFLKTLPSRIGLLLDIPLKGLEHILSFEKYIVVEPGTTSLKLHQLLTEEDYINAQNEFGEDAFVAMMGAAALQTILTAMDLKAEQALCYNELKDLTSEIKRKKLIKRLKMITSFIEANIRPEWMIFDVIPVIPPELRPLVPLDGGRFATSDLNDLYRRVINRNNRLKRLISLKSPEIILRNEKRMLQEAVDALFDNGRRGHVITGVNKQSLKSLSDMLKGKQGRFRQNLLGKRVDYSGRSVIVVGPELKLYQCGLPKKMALELFKPLIYAKLELYGLSPTIKLARQIVERERPEVWDILEEVIREHPVLLNRAPTLHRLGIQAFEPVLVEGKAIQLHPLVCAAFNADFDGDQMAVHVPLSVEAQLEARVLMMSTNNILSPAHGKPIIVPSQDIILGLYYISLARDHEKGEGMRFSSIGEIEAALDAKMISLHTKITARYHEVDQEGQMIRQHVETTPGRMLLYEILPRHPSLPFSMINRLLSKKEITDIIDAVYRHCGQKETVIFADQLMKRGFYYACRSGISIGKDDLVIPPAKQRFLSQAKQRITEYEQQYLDGLLLQGEKYNKVIDVWSECTDKIASEMMKVLSDQTPNNPHINSVYMMIDSGARGSIDQVRQLAGMRGLMAKPSGEIIEHPITSNFKEGLSVFEYFNSTHGARKGLADTALKTSNSGYLTRRLVDVAQDCIITEEDCGTTEGIMVEAIISSSGDIIVSLAERILGRIIAQDVIHPVTGEQIVAAGTMIEESHVELFTAAQYSKVKIRSVLVCESLIGLCSHCYGRDLARGTRVNIGEAVGVIAAQSIGEPGTQLTMRTFHTGGVVLRETEQRQIEALFDATIQIHNRNVVMNNGMPIVMGRNCEIILSDDNGVERIRHRLPYGAKLFTDHNQTVTAGQTLAEWDPHTFPIITEQDGITQYVDLSEGISMHEVIDEATGLLSRTIIDWQQHPQGKDMRPCIVIVDDQGQIVKLASGFDTRYLLSPETIISVDNQVAVKAGDVIARTPRDTSKTVDITATMVGLPRVVELFEARRPKDCTILSEIDGRVSFGKDYRTRRRLIVRNEESDIERAYIIPKDKIITVQEGDMVQKGESLISSGHPAAHDILEIMGVEALAHYLISEIQKVYRHQGVKINDKHIEVIIRQMLRKVEIIHSGQTTFLIGEQVDKLEFNEMNEKAIAEKLTPAKAKRVLLGITKASLQTRSFISAASFQETTRILIDAAVSGKVDPLNGLKENVIVGRLIPAGTGSVIRKLKEQKNKKQDDSDTDTLPIDTPHHRVA